MIAIILLLALGGLMHATVSFTVGTAPGSAGTALAFGYLLLTAFFTGTVFKRIGLPRLTGYLATGLVTGPSVLGLLPDGAVENLSIFTGVAVALIALAAGTELELRSMRPLLRSLVWITSVARGGTMLLIAATVLLLAGLLPFTQGMGLSQTAAVAMVLAVVMVAGSPAVVVALGNELRAEGPVSRTVLGAVVLGDLVVIVLFAFVSTLAKATFGAAGDAAATVRLLAWELLGSLVAGALIGGVLAAYLRKVAAGAGLFVLTTCFVVAEVGRRLRFDPLLVALAAGVLIRNLTDVGDRLHAGIESSALPVYITFFAVAGATIHLDVLAVVGVPALILVVVRGAGLLAGTRFAARMAGAPEPVQRFAGFGLLPQAGLALALSMLFAKAFPEFGRDAGALTLGVVAINEIVAPVLYRIALVRSGEADRRAEEAPASVPSPYSGPPPPVTAASPIPPAPPL